MRLLRSDLLAASRLPPDYETDLEENQEEKESFFSLSLETRNWFQRKHLAEKVNKQMNELIALLTRSLNIHLNIGQRFQVNTTAIVMILENVTRQSLSNKQISTFGNALLRLPPTLNISLHHSSPPSLRVRLFSLLFSSSIFSLVHFGTFAFLRSILDFDNNEFLSIDFSVSTRSTRKCNSSSNDS